MGKNKEEEIEKFGTIIGRYCGRCESIKESCVSCFTVAERLTNEGYRKHPTIGTHCHICHEEIKDCECFKRVLTPSHWNGKVSPYRLFEMSYGNPDEYKRLLIEHGHFKEIGTQPSNLVPLDEQKLVDILWNLVGISGVDAITVAKHIYAKFGTPAIPSVEDIAQVMRKHKSEWTIICGVDQLAQATHELIKKGKDKP